MSTLSYEEDLKKMEGLSVGRQIRKVYTMYQRLINEQKFDEISTMLRTLDLAETNTTIMVCHLTSAHWCYIEVETAYREYYDRLLLRLADEDLGESQEGKKWTPKDVVGGLSPEDCDKKYKNPHPLEKQITAIGDVLGGIKIDRG